MSTLQLVLLIISLVVTMLGVVGGQAFWLSRYLDSKFAAVNDKMDIKFQAVDDRFVALNDKMDIKFNEVDRRLAEIEKAMPRTLPHERSSGG